MAHDSSSNSSSDMDVYQQRVSEAVEAQQRVRMDISPGKVSESDRKLRPRKANKEQDSSGSPSDLKDSDDDTLYLPGPAQLRQSSSHDSSGDSSRVRVSPRKSPVKSRRRAKRIPGRGQV